MSIFGRQIALVLAGALSASVLSFFAYRFERSALVSRHQAEIAQLRRQAAENESKEYRRALFLIEGQRALIQSETDRALAAIAGIPTSLESERSRLRSTLKEFANDASFDCRRLPLPDAVLDQLRRPGEPRHSPDRAASSGIHPAPASVSHGTSAEF